MTYERGQYSDFDRNLDRLLTGKKTAFPVMLLLLSLILWITVSGANYPSQWLSACFDLLIGGVSALLRDLDVPDWLHGMTVDGILRIPAWVVSVMLPPMAIFFPLFTLLEDAGYLPRVAYNLDRPFHACHACGKQALTMCMGLGCNAAGVVGCRIIDSPRERLLAILTNSLMPCNGRFPALIAILSLLMIGASGSMASSLLSAFLLTLLIALAVGMTLLTTRLLSATMLRGVPSSFTLEMLPGAGDAPVPPSSDRQSTGAIGIRPNAFRPGTRVGGRGTRGTGDLVIGKPLPWRSNASGTLRRFSGSLCTAFGNGRHHFTGIYSGLSCK